MSVATATGTRRPSARIMGMTPTAGISAALGSPTAAGTAWSILTLQLSCHPGGKPIIKERCLHHPNNTILLSLHSQACTGRQRKRKSQH